MLALLPVASVTVPVSVAHARIARASSSNNGGSSLGGTSSTTTGSTTTGTTTTGTTTTGQPTNSAPSGASTPTTTGQPINSATGGASTPTTAAVVTLTGFQQPAGDGITLSVAQFAEMGQALQITGSAPSTDAGDTIEIEGTSTPAGATWSELTSATVAADGSFTAAWTPSSSAAFTLEATLVPELNQAESQSGGGALPDADTAAALTGTQTFTLPVFKLSTATLYGPGFWGKHTACGGVLRRSTLGVANRTLPCGTMVAVYYGGRELSVPVIDRGPYANHASWDLTWAAAKALHMTETSRVGTLAPVPTTLFAAVRHGA